MKTGSMPVKAKGKTVGTAEFPIFDSIEEAVADQGGEAAVVALINAQIKQVNCQRLRAALTGKPTKATIQLEAFMAIDPGEVATHKGDKAWLQNRIEEEAVKIRARYEDAAGVTPEEDLNADPEDAEEEE